MNYDPMNTEERMSMKEIQIRHENISEYPNDIKRLLKVLYDRGFIASPEQATILWEKYSDSMCAGWMMMSDDDNRVFECVSPCIVNQKTTPTPDPLCKTIK